MIVTIWGVRGSIAAAGAATARYGGNTSCVAVRGPAGGVLILDAGTGIRPLGCDLGRGIGRVDILLTHLHVDHLQGLAFFEPLFDPHVEVNVWGPRSAEFDFRAGLTRYLSPPLFPIHRSELPAFHMREVPAGPFRVGEFEVLAALVSHPGATLGYRIAAGGATLAYLPDHELARGGLRGPAARMSGLAVARGVDLLLHDAQYTPAEYSRRVGWGHSTIGDALAFAAAAGVKHLVTFHHDPSHDDQTLDRITRAAVEEAGRLPFRLTIGAEGAVFDLGGEEPLPA